MQYEQPRAQAPMTTNGGNRNPKNKPYNGQGQREWSHGLCDCFGDCGTCFIACCCPCITYGQNKTRLEHLQNQGYPHREGGDSFGSDCCVYGLLACIGFGWVLQIGTRGEVRKRYAVEGGTCGDCMVSWCCAPCALTQESREIEGEERSMGAKA